MAKRHGFLLLTVLLLAHATLRAGVLAGNATPAQAKPMALGQSALQQSAFGRLLAGGNWETTIALLNVTSTNVTFRQFFFNGQGSLSPYTVQLDADGTTLKTSAIQGELGPGASVSFTLQQSGGATQEGWSLLNFDGAAAAVQGYAVLRRRAADGTVIAEADLPLSGMQDSSVYLPFDNTRQFQTELTIVNPAADLPARVRLTYLDQHGNTMLVDALSLPPGTQTTINLPNTYPDLANKVGVIAVEADLNRLTVSGLRKNLTSAVIAVLPVMNSSTSPVQ